MNWFTLAILAFLGFGLTNFMFKVGERLGVSIAVLTVTIYAVGTILSALWFFSQKQLTLGAVDPKPVVIGVIAAFFSILGTIAVQQAFRGGAASLISPIVALNGIIVVVGSLLIFNEVITPKQLIGVVIALLAVVLITSK